MTKGFFFRQEAGTSAGSTIEGATEHLIGSLVSRPVLLTPAKWKARNPCFRCTSTIGANNLTKKTETSHILSTKKGASKSHDVDAVLTRNFESPELCPEKFGK